MSLLDKFEKNVGALAGFELPVGDVNTGVGYDAPDGVFKTQRAAAPNMSWDTDQFHFLFYDKGFITQVAPNGLPVLSGPFGGCFMVVYKRGGTLYVGHIGTKDGDPNADVKQAWTAFEGSNDATNKVVLAFNPQRSVENLPLVVAPPRPPPSKETPDQLKKRVKKELDASLKAQDEALKKAKKVTDLLESGDKDLPQLYALVTSDVANPKAYAVYMVAQKLNGNQRRILTFKEIKGTTKGLFPAH